MIKGQLSETTDFFCGYFENFNLPTIYFLNIFNCQTVVVMKTSAEIKAHQLKLLNRYKHLIEQAYNFRQTDHALSDISEFKAIKLLNKLNRLKYLNRESSIQV